ncbi:MAG: glutathione-disulfide reductase [Alphaproteobacteria bacterium]|nr:glutathione-disulfide reductase [Alphaproteobacteria bacterium]
MARYDCDLFVIGAGSGGVRAARIAGGHGARVMVAEDDRVGGTCVIRGCIPKKLFVYASRFAPEFADAAAYGWTLGETRFDWPTLLANKDREIERLSGIYRRLLANAGVELIEARARLLDRHLLEVGGRRISAERILIATGGRPVYPPVPGAELGVTSNEAFHFDRLPGRIVIVGGGYIALEFAGIFNGLGVDTTVVYRGPQVLRGFDDDVRQAVADGLLKHGVKLLTRLNLKALARAEPGVAATLTDGRVLRADRLMFATGRAPNTADLGLAALGVALTPTGAVKVDEWSQSSVPGIYAIGDVTDRINLTPVATMEGHALADTLYGGRARLADHANVPHAVFSQPEVAAVGLTEAEARARFPHVDIYRTSFRPLKHTLTGRPEQTMMKLVVDATSDRVVGAHMVGDHAAEIMQGVAIAVKLGATKAQFDATVGIHPSAAEEFVTLRTKVPAPLAKAAE